MESLFKNIIHVLEKINTSLPKPILTQPDLIEEKENIQDYIVLKDKINTLVSEIDNTDLNNKKKIASEIVYLYVNYSNIVWHAQQIEECLTKVISSLPAEYFNESEDGYEEYCDDLRRKDINKLDKTFEEMIGILEKINTLLLNQDMQKNTPKKEKIYVKNFITLRNQFVSLMSITQGLLR